jgi:hypothetical protein
MSSSGVVRTSPWVATTRGDIKRPDRFCSFDQAIYGHLTRRNLAALATERGDHAEAERFGPMS